MNSGKSTLLQHLIQNLYSVVTKPANIEETHIILVSENNATENALREHSNRIYPNMSQPMASMPQHPAPGQAPTASAIRFSIFYLNLN